MQVVHVVTEYPHNNNFIFCLTNFGMITRGYIQHSEEWWLDVIFIGMLTRRYIIYGHSDEILGVMLLLMQVVHVVTEYLHNNNFIFCLTNFGMITRGYIQHSEEWWLDVIFIGMLTRRYIIYGHSDEILGVM